MSQETFFITPTQSASLGDIIASRKFLKLLFSNFNSPTYNSYKISTLKKLLAFILTIPYADQISVGWVFTLFKNLIMLKLHSIFEETLDVLDQNQISYFDQLEIYNATLFSTEILLSFMKNHEFEHLPFLLSFQKIVEVHEIHETFFSQGLSLLYDSLPSEQQQFVDDFLLEFHTHFNPNDFPRFSKDDLDELLFTILHHFAFHTKQKHINGWLLLFENLIPENFSNLFNVLEKHHEKFLNIQTIENFHLSNKICIEAFKYGFKPFTKGLDLQKLLKSSPEDFC